MSGPVAVVLAAGGSGRLGRPKQLLKRDGEVLVQRALRLAGTTAPQRTLLVLGAQAEAIAGALQLDQVQVLHSPHWQSGLSASVQAAREALAASAVMSESTPVLFLVCDQPALEAPHLLALLRAARTTASGCAATLHGLRRGVPAVVAWKHLLRATLQGDAGLRELLNDGSIGGIATVDAPDLTLDLDTPADVRAAIARGWLDPDQADG